jgi:hypothetical protein
MNKTKTIPGIPGATPLIPGGGTGWGGAWPRTGYGAAIGRRMLVTESNSLDNSRHSSVSYLPANHLSNHLKKISAWKYDTLRNNYKENKIYPKSIYEMK